VGIGLNNWLLRDVESVTNGDNHDEKHSVVDGVDDAVVTDPEAKPGTIAEWARRRRSQILSARSDRALDARLNGRVTFSNLPPLKS
jgi:hypothetical protein